MDHKKPPFEHFSKCESPARLNILKQIPSRTPPGTLDFERWSAKDLAPCEQDLLQDAFQLRAGVGCRKS